MNLDLTPEFDSFIATKIRSASYKNATEVVEAALAFLEREEREDEGKMQALIQAIDEGEASGIAEGDFFQRSREARCLRRRQSVALG